MYVLFSLARGDGTQMCGVFLHEKTQDIFLQLCVCLKTQTACAKSQVMLSITHSEFVRTWWLLVSQRNRSMDTLFIV